MLTDDGMWSDDAEEDETESGEDFDFDEENEDVGFEDGAVTTAPEAEKNKYLIIYLILINQYSIILNLIN